MRKILKHLPLWLSAFLLVVGCTLQTNPVPTLPPFPTPNRTMTALFSTPLPTIALTKPAASLPTSSQPAVATAQPTAAASPTIAASATTAPQPTAQAATSSPSETSAPVDLSQRTGTSVSAKLLATPPKIDGDWSDLPPKEYPADFVVYGASNWKNSEDLSASFRIGWDANNLYIGVKVHDDVYVQNASGADLFKGDSIEILLDTNVAGDYYYDSLSPDDFQLGISPGRPDVNGTKEAYRWLPANLAGTRSNVVIASSRSETEKITRYEVAIPWSTFEVTPKSGQHFGFAFSVSDNDNPSQNLQQTLVSNVKSRILTDPTTWGDLTLAP